MKHFLKKTTIFSLCILLLLISAEIYVRHLPNPYKDKHRWMLQHSRSVKTLVLGSSHTFYGIDASLLPDTAFNLANPAQPYRYDYYLLKHYPTDRLRNVILPYSYFSLYYDFENDPREWWNGIRYRLYMDCDLHSKLSYYGFECSSINSLVNQLQSLWKPNPLSWDSLGRGTDLSYAHRAPYWDDGELGVNLHTYADTSAVALNTALLDSILDYCKSRRINVLLITTPLSPNFRKYQDSIQTSRNARVLHDILKKHKEVKYLDFSADTLFRDSDFHDSHHMSEYGAAKLSRMLHRYLY